LTTAAPYPGSDPDRGRLSIFGVILFPTDDGRTTRWPGIIRLTRIAISYCLLCCDGFWRILVLPMAQKINDWHTTTRIADNVYRISEPFGTIEPRVGVNTVNMYLVIGRDRAVLIDSGMGIGDVRSEIARITPLPCAVLNTHFHWDHIGANARFAERAIHASEVELVAQEPDVAFIRQALQSPTARAALPASFDPAAYRVSTKPATRVLHDNDLIDLGGCALRVLHIPGHSPGHVAYWLEANNLLFTGDTAYRGPLYACFEGSDPAAFAQSLKRLARLPGVATICPGHNDVIRDQDWLSELAQFVETAVEGKIPGRPRDDFIVGQEYRSTAFTIWLPQ
jgi:glyoxylase-like metal-dependent hydrolase (beta-lactamase superfamily II)